MTELSKQILAKYQVRKSRGQKQAFSEFLQKHIPEMSVQTSKFPLNRNLIIGDVEKAEVILSAHYDTCARMLVPNFITPMNTFLSICYSFLIFFPIFIIVFLLNLLLSCVTTDFFIHYIFSMVIAFGIFCFMMVGPANKHTANDNTSGVIALCEIYAKLPEELKDKVVFVFFDNEEKGLIGSAAFRKEYKKILSEKIIINMDCVSDGDHLLFAVSKKARAKYGSAIEEVFQSEDEKKILIKRAEKTYYPSDQAGFPHGVAVASMKYKKGIGYYINRIHTKKDTVMDVRNIEYLSNHVIEFLRKI